MRTLIISAVIATVGCGPLTAPMVARLGPEQQAEADAAWQNMFDPPNRLDRTLLLDVLIKYQMYQSGVDRLSLTSEKDVSSGRVVMAVSYDRNKPEFDAFTMSYYGNDGRQIRREVYTREDVERRMEFLCRETLDHIRATNASEPSNQADDTASSTIPDTVDESNRIHSARLKRIRAATRPAE
ncbi:MAG: hypothetical protein O7D94_04010 [Planctomycetota bacterium]|nr:hypothetical protein [Planctomycetota bacterium]